MSRGGAYGGRRGGGGARGARGAMGGGRGRGEYYRNKYGGGGRGEGGSAPATDHHDDSSSRHVTGGGSYMDLHNCLRRIDGKSYGAYHELDTPPDRGWINSSAGYELFVERAQSDPFAPPTRCRVVLDTTVAGYPASLYSNPVRRMALADFVLRNMYRQCKQLGADSALNGKGWGGPKGGDIQILEPGQNVLEQSAVQFDERGCIIAQLTINLPARGRTILGEVADDILGNVLPAIVERGLYYIALNAHLVKAHVESVEDQCWLQSQLDHRDLVAFIANGSILPRMSGVDDRPMDTSKAIPFMSPTRLEVSFTLPNTNKGISGLGIRKGITLICGGGFHGKSTMLEALQCGIYPKIPGDGREFCLTSSNAFKVRAEDGRNVQAVDISTFINGLPFGKDTNCFSTGDASGSTSQATNIVEAIEVGVDALLIDEDTCATNFMIRDNKMMQLVAADKEPITPFLSIVRSLYDDKGISTVMVVGGIGDYFDVADNVLVMDSYCCNDATERAKQIVACSKSLLPHNACPSVSFRDIQMRSLVVSHFAAIGKVKTVSKSTISYGETELDISGLEQLASVAQTTAIANALQRIPSLSQQHLSLRAVLEAIEQNMNAEGLDCLAPGQYHGGMARPRRFEIAGAVNRLRRPQSIIQTNCKW